MDFLIWLLLVIPLIYILVQGSRGKFKNNNDVTTLWLQNNKLLSITIATIGFLTLAYYLITEFSNQNIWITGGIGIFYILCFYAIMREILGGEKKK